MEKGVQRWMVDISKWDPSPLDFSSALSVLPQPDHPSITRFIKMDDRKRALVSRLLQYALVHEILGIPYDGIVISRTMEGKPYLDCHTDELQFPNFNFNVSHQGDFVLIASEPLCLIGVDVISCDKPQNETIPQFLRNFTPYFSSFEWENIRKSDSFEENLTDFYRYWCLKEAYVKATGDGLAHGLDKIEFHHTDWSDIFVKVDGEPVMEWRFWLSELPKNHWVSIARGHPKHAAESFKRVLNWKDFEETEYLKCLSLPNSQFTERKVEQLISVLHRTQRRTDQTLIRVKTRS